MEAATSPDPTVATALADGQQTQMCDERMTVDDMVAKTEDANATAGGRSAPYRVVVWGPGNLGRAALRELLRRDEFEVVAVLAHTPEREGKDAGVEVLGGEPIGVMTTTDKEAIYAMQGVDCVVHVARVTPHMTDDVVRLLESGKNVVSSSGFHNPEFHGSEYLERLNKACEKGQSTLYGTGLHPNLMYERITLASTGLTGRVKHIAFSEITDLSQLGPEAVVILHGTGLGIPPEALWAALERTPVKDTWIAQYYIEALHFMLSRLYGATRDDVRVDIEVEPILAKDDMQTTVMPVPKGYTMAMKYIYSAYIGDERRATMTQYYYLGAEACPLPDPLGQTTHIAEVEGDPVSYRMRFDTGGQLRPAVDRPNDPTIQTAYACITPLIQAIPRIHAAEPGVVVHREFSYAADDLRTTVPPMSASKLRATLGRAEGLPTADDPSPN